MLACLCLRLHVSIVVCLPVCSRSLSEWIPTDQIWTYLDHRAQFLEPSELVNPLFQRAVDEMEPLVRALPGYTEVSAVKLHGLGIACSNDMH